MSKDNKLTAPSLKTLRSHCGGLGGRTFVNAEFKKEKEICAESKKMEGRINGDIRWDKVSMYPRKASHC